MSIRDGYRVRVSVQLSEFGETIAMQLIIDRMMLDDAFRPLPRHRTLDYFAMGEVVALRERRRRAIDMLASNIAQGLAVAFDRRDDEHDGVSREPVQWPEKVARGPSGTDD